MPNGSSNGNESLKYLSNIHENNEHVIQTNDNLTKENALKLALGHRLRSLENIEATQDQQARLADTEYVAKIHNTIERNKHEISFGFRSINSILTSLDSLKAAQLAEKNGVNILPAKQTHPEIKKLELHSSLGSRYANQGSDVLEFDMAGSGFKEPPKRYKYFTGKGKYKMKYADGTEKEFNFSKGHKTISKFERFLGFFKKSYIHKKKKKYEEYNKEYDEAFKEYEETYGYRIPIENKVHKYIRMKSTTNELGATKTKYSLAGPLGLLSKGILNIGTYGITNLQKYVRTLGKNWLTPRLDKMKEEYEKDGEDALSKMKPIHIIVNSHSRGAVAATPAMLAINQWIYSTYPEKIANMVKFDIRSNDPVPGRPSTIIRGNTRLIKKAALKGNITGTGIYDKDGNELTDKEVAKDNKRPFEKRKGVYRALNKENTRHTVVYSMQADYSFFFRPTELISADRLIITPFTHSINLTTTGDTKRVSDDKTKQMHHEAFVDFKNNQAYRQVAINDLTKGVYIVNENSQLIKLDNAEQFDKIIETYVKDASIIHTQYPRKRVLKRLVRKWFENNEENQS
ncbi:MAG: hypothetical protein K6B41_12550 [Butyrivibrio sp.]|nr:hypothetical protein [Butyrivibrio sp.]